MNVNEKFLSFPPFLSTSWIYVSSLSINKEGNINVHMNSGEIIILPEISKNEIDLIFQFHAQFLENQILNEHPMFKQKKLPSSLKEQIESEFPLRFSFGSLDGMGTAMQHNPAQKNAPDLPQEMLEKISEVSKILAPSDPEQIPKPEPHCNCYHCQIARAILGTESDRLIEEEVSIEELQFEQWRISQTGEKLFNVTNKLDPLENYSVHLGHPVGCTCGKQNCEHILAVLKS